MIIRGGKVVPVRLFIYILTNPVVARMKDGRPKMSSHHCEVLR